MFQKEIQDLQTRHADQFCVVDEEEDTVYFRVFPDESSYLKDLNDQRSGYSSILELYRIDSQGIYQY